MSNKLTGIYSKPFQKSKVFLYPKLNVKPGSSETPIMTYIVWPERYELEDRKLICKFNLRKDKFFSNFEQNVLLGNELFEDYIEIEDNQGLYIFDMAREGPDDFDNFLKGRYSKLSHNTKECIKRFHVNNLANFNFIDSWINPTKYHPNYTEILFEKEEYQKGLAIIKSIHELCAKPDLCVETLNFTSVKANL